MFFPLFVALNGWTIEQYTIEPSNTYSFQNETDIHSRATYNETNPTINEEESTFSDKKENRTEDQEEEYGLHTFMTKVRIELDMINLALMIDTLMRVLWVSN